MNVLYVLAQSTFSVELFSTDIAYYCKFAGVMEHVSFKLGVLDESFAANSTNMIATTCVRSHVTI
jgi:hypothetical protein